MRLVSPCLLSLLSVLCLGPQPAFADVGGETAKLLAGDGVFCDHFGIGVAIDGNTAIVGSPGDSDNGDASGSAYVFDTITGLQLLKLVPNDGAVNDFFGQSVGISGNTAVVGSRCDDDNGNDSGSAYLYNTVTGALIAKLLPSDGAADDNFGFAVAISGNTAIVSAPGDDDNGSGSGSAYLFDAVTGVQIVKLLHNGGPGFDGFGESVGIHGSTAIVGANNDPANGTNSGSAYLFNALTGVQIAKLLPSDGTAGNLFGLAVAVSDTTAIVSGFGDDDNGIFSGSAYLFDLLTGTQIAKLLPSDGAAVDLFGRFVSISGTTAIVGAEGHDDLGNNSGSAYLFDARTGVQIAELLSSDGAANDIFGECVAISGSIAIVGAPGDDFNGSLSGSATLFDIPILADATTRNGSGLNAVILSQVADPVQGGNFIVDLDCTGHGASVGVLKFYEGASSGFFLNGGELLINLASPFLGSFPQAHTGGVIQFSLPVPSDPALCGVTASVQAVVLGAPGYELSNALDIVVGL